MWIYHNNKMANQLSNTLATNFTAWYSTLAVIKCQVMCATDKQQSIPYFEGEEMTSKKHLCFLSDIVKEKNHYQGQASRCPFCHREDFAEILAEEDSVVLIKNKFPTLANAYQTVLIETDDCHSHIPTYSFPQMRKIITFGIDHWLAMERSGDYASVLFYKNHGPLSGGTIDHAHMQIVGLKDIDYKTNLSDDIFEGIEIYNDGSNTLNLSTKPNACPMEFNIIANPRQDAFMAAAIQQVVKYILKQSNSFNLFFYEWNRSIVCKVVPRYVTSPFLVGYCIPQTSNRLNSIVDELKGALHFPDMR